jgi:hypothetical protein
VKRATISRIRRGRLGLAACAVLILVGAGIVHFGRVISGGLDTIAGIAPAAGVASVDAVTQPETRVAASASLGAAGIAGESAGAVSPALAEVESELAAALGMPVVLPPGVREALAQLEPIETPDQLLVIEPGIPSNVYVRPGTVSLSPQQRRVQAAQFGDEQAIREIIADLDSGDPAASRDAWSALRRVARTGDMARLRSLAAEMDPGLEDRVAELLESVTYD